MSRLTFSSSSLGSSSNLTRYFACTEYFPCYYLTMPCSTNSDKLTSRISISPSRNSKLRPDSFSHWDKTIRAVKRLGCVSCVFCNYSFSRETGTVSSLSRKS